MQGGASAVTARPTKPALCRFALLGRCQRGALCAFAHSPEELSSNKGGAPSRHGGYRGAGGPQGGGPRGPLNMHNTAQPRPPPSQGGGGPSLSAAGLKPHRALQGREQRGPLDNAEAEAGSKHPQKPAFGGPHRGGGGPGGGTGPFKPSSANPAGISTEYGAPRAAKEWRRRVTADSAGGPPPVVVSGGGPPSGDAEKATPRPSTPVAALGAAADADAAAGAAAAAAADLAAAAGRGAAAAAPPQGEAPAAHEPQQLQQQPQQLQQQRGEPGAEAGESVKQAAAAGGAPQGPGPRMVEGPRRMVSEVWSTEGPVSCNAWVLPAEKLRGPSDNRFLAPAPDEQQQQQEAACSSSKRQLPDSASSSHSAKTEEPQPATGVAAAAAAGDSAAAAAGPAGAWGPRRGLRGKGNAWRTQQQSLPAAELSQQQQRQQQQQQHGAAALPYAGLAKEAQAPLSGGDTGLSPCDASAAAAAAAQHEQQPVSGRDLGAAGGPCLEDWGPLCWGPPHGPSGASSGAVFIATELQQQQQQQHELAAYSAPKTRSPLDLSAAAAATPAAAAAAAAAAGPCPYFPPSCWGAPNYLALVGFCKQQQHVVELLQHCAPLAYEE
ncbi:hypothetical protein Efla_002343 [Eimeria flavescens]